MRVLVVLALTLVGLQTACTASSGPASSSFARELSALAPTPASYGAPRSARPLPLAPGQWVKRHLVDQDGRHSLVTTKVIGLFGRQVWLENETETDAGASSVKLLLSVGDRKDARRIDIFQYWKKHSDGHVEQTPSMLLGGLKPQLQNVIAQVLVLHHPEGQEDVSVVAGHFTRAYRARFEVKGLGTRVPADTWFHSQVPFNGALRTVAGSSRSELVAFGLSGAKSAF